MRNFKRGTPAFGLFTGLLFAGLALLWMTLGFWRMLLLLVVFVVGYFVGAINNMDTVKEAVDRVVPEKDQTIDFRKELEKEQESRYGTIDRTEDKE